MAQACIPRPRVIALLNCATSDHVVLMVHKTCLPSLIHSSRTYSQTSRKCISQRRHAHTKRHVSTAVTLPASEQSIDQALMSTTKTTALSCLPLSTLLRSYLITSVSSIPLLLKPSLIVMGHLAHSKSRWLNPDHNRLLHFLLKRTLYNQFCAGETPAEVRKTISSLKQIGYKGVILNHAREVVLSKEEAAALGSAPNTPAQEAADAEELKQWRDDLLETVMLTEKGDFVAMKFTGSGRRALQHLKATIPCAPALRDAVHEVCKLAEQRGVALLFDAEQAMLQDSIDNWTMYYMRHYNKNGKAVVYNTYQAYMKRCPDVLASHLAAARKEGFVLGVKLVRGAYMGSDPRELFWNTIEDTHKCYDDLAECVMQRRYSDMLKPIEGEKEFPQVEIVLASHNAESVQKAQAIRDEQARMGQPRIRMAYAQLMGMADHISCELVQQSKTRKSALTPSGDIAEAYKYIAWSSMGTCMKYLYRRAQENKDAVSRTVDARRALGKEIAVRMGLVRP